MPFRAIQPSALGSAWDYDIIWEDPWTNWTGTRTWSQMFDDIRADTGYGTDIVDRIGSTYFVFKRLRFVGITILEPLLESSIICRNTGLIAFHAGCDVQFGTTAIVGGEEVANRGCTIVEDTGSGSRANDNFNKNTRIVMDSTLRLYDTVFQRVNQTRSDFDWSADSLVVMRNVTLQMRGNHFNHFYGKMDIDGLVVQTQSGSSIEFRTAMDDFIKFDNVFPYRLDLNEDQRVLVLFVPSGSSDFSVIYSFNNYRGVNFARWSLGSGRAAEFINPYSVNLQSVGGNSGRSGHAFERRTVRLELQDTSGNLVEGARAQIQHRIDGFTIPEGWLMNDQFPYDVNEVTDSSGVINTMLNRRYWRHSSPQQQINGVNQQQHEFHNLTPHIMRVYKYGLQPVEQPVDVTPSGNGAGGFSLSYSMLNDIYTTLTKSQALDLGTNITVAFHPTPVTWQGLEWDCTITSDLTATQIYQWIRAIQDEGTALGGDFLPNLMPNPREVERGIHNRQLKSFRIVTTSGNAVAGIERMVSKNGTAYVPPVQVMVSFTNLRPNSEVRLFRTSDRSEIAGVEYSGDTFTYSYIYDGTDVDFYYVVFHLDYLPIKITGLTLNSQNQTFRIAQVFDRNYSNP